jgi:threonine dehydrogenase-like Zn-dependent dehydrogenase
VTIRAAKPDQNPLPLAALTAWQALTDHTALQPGEQVLVQGADGVGLFAVQLAGILGGHVTATGRSADAGFVRDLGAERFISAGAGQPGPAAGGFDVVIDTVGGACWMARTACCARAAGWSPWARPRTRSWRAGTRSTRPRGSPRSASGASRCLVRGHGTGGRAGAPASAVEGRSLRR